MASAERALELANEAVANGDFALSDKWLTLREGALAQAAEYARYCGEKAKVSGTNGTVVM